MENKWCHERHEGHKGLAQSFPCRTQSPLLTEACSDDCICGRFRLLLEPHNPVVGPTEGCGGHVTLRNRLISESF